ncbi:MAG: ABC transporter substrate-binding protein [Acidimicrobiia bacterium]|nr:ABC transporter substrate-binding protein [Acidimicrobiia bacterium]
MISRKPSAAALVVVLAFAGTIFAAGTASASAPTGVASAAKCTNDTGVTDTEIKVGAIIPTSGPSATSFAAAQDGIKARFAKANAESELGKRKLVLDVADDAADPARNLTAAQQLVEQNGDFGVISVTNASDSSGAYLNQQKIPVTGWHVGNSAWGKYKNMFGWRNSNVEDPSKTFTTRNADVVKTLGGTKIALVGSNAASSATFIGQLDTAMKKGGVKVVYKTNELTPADRDFTGIAQKIKDSGADSVYTGLDLVQNAALNAALEQAGAKPKVIVFPGGYDRRVLTIPGIEDAVFSIEFKPFELNPPAFAEYQKWMQSELPDANFAGQVPYIGWLSAEAFIEGLKAAGKDCPTRKAFITKLRKEKGYDANGAFDPVDFAKVFGKPILCVYYVQVKNGAFVPLFNSKAVCPKALIVDGKLKPLTPAQTKNS